MCCLWLHLLNPQGKGLSLLTFSSFQIYSRGRSPKPMFLSILPSYMVIFIISLVVKEFFQFPISFLCELFHMKTNCWYVYGGRWFTVLLLHRLNPILYHKFNSNIFNRKCCYFFIYIWNTLYLKIHQVNVKTKIIVAIFWYIYMIIVNTNCISLYTAIIFTA